MTNSVQDPRLAVRLLAKNPGFSAVIIATLALAMGANTSVFSLLNAVLLRRLPGVEAVGADVMLPLTPFGASTMGIQITRGDPMVARPCE